VSASRPADVPRRSRTRISGSVDTKRPIDAAAFLTVWAAALLLIPAALVVQPLGAAGSPAQLLGLVAGTWWVGAQLDRAHATLTPPQPVRRAAVIFAGAMLVSYLVATTRAIDTVELSAADRGMLLVASWLGVTVMCGDGLPSRERLDTLLRRVITMAGAAAILGAVQFFSGRSFVDQLTIPGLSPNTGIASVYDRNGFSRAAGTSTHPIEFGVMLTMILPIALHYALNDTNRSRLRRWWPVAAIAVAVPVTMSRSTVVGVAVVLLVVLPTWTKKRRRATYVAVVALLLTVYLAVPGLLGTMVRLFTGIATDNSTQSRTDSYTFAWQFITRSPVFGRGFSTFLPEYRILDNQYLGLLVETGVVGLVAFIALIVTAIGVAARLRRSSTDPVLRSLLRAFIACLAAAACAFATFDAFGFPQVAGLLFLVLGCVSVVWRLETLPTARLRAPDADRPTARVLRRRARAQLPDAPVSVSGGSR
jgi:hypothetical protein